MVKIIKETLCVEAETLKDIFWYIQGAIDQVDDFRFNSYHINALLVAINVLNEKANEKELELKMEDFGINKASIMQELIDEFGFDLIFNSLCETRLKDLKRELDKRINEVE